jgi:hypothetical protein
MKALILSLLLSMAAFGLESDNPKVILFNRADTEHCKAVVLSGRQFLHSEYGGTKVAIDLPVATPDGDFQVFVSVEQTGVGQVEVNPKDFLVYYSDPAHTQLPFYDKSSLIAIREAQSRGHSTASGITGANTQTSTGSIPGTPPPPGSLNSNAWTGRSRTDTGQDPNAPARQQEQARERAGSHSPQDTAPQDTSVASSKPAGFLTRITLS